MHALTQNDLNKSESGRPAKWSAGKVVRSTGLAGLALAGVFALGQAAITAKQWLAEREAEPMLAAMRAEQAWLMEHNDGFPGVRSD